MSKQGGKARTLNPDKDLCCLEELNEPGVPDVNCSYPKIEWVCKGCGRVWWQDIDAPVPSMPPMTLTDKMLLEMIGTDIDALIEQGVLNSKGGYTALGRRLYLAAISGIKDGLDE
jgi:hypothetical protein